MPEFTVLLMLKAPIPGTVKTRLGRDIGADAATESYRKLVEHQLAQIPSDWRRHVCFAPASEGRLMREWLGGDLEYSAQTEGDLGARLARAVEIHFQGQPHPLLIVGGDCPYLSTACLREAAALLSENDTVLIPADDGGYCLIALRAPEMSLFLEIHWSTGSVLTETRERLRQRGLRWTEMAALEDVDDAAGWARAQMAFPHLGERRR